MLKHFLFFLTFTVASAGFSQTVFLNPFSSYGLGNQILSSDAIQSSLGRSSIGFNDSTMVSYLNSANIASLTKGYPLFSLGMNGSLTKFSEGTNTYNSGFVALDHMIFAVPFRKRYGVAFGLAPYARRGYSFENDTLVGEGDTVSFEYEGRGSLSKAFVGLSYKIIDGSKFNFSVGSNLGYLFGTTTNARVSTLSSANTSTGGALQSDRLQSFHYDFSVNLTYTFNDTVGKKNHLQINGYYDPSQRLTGTYADELFYVSSGGTQSLISSINTDAIYISASSIRFGANYATQFQRSTKKNKVFTSELTFVGEYASTQFSAFKKDYNAAQFSSFQSDYTRYSFGVQYTPNIGYQSNLNPTGFFNKLKYRVGTYSGTLPYQHGGENFTEFGTTFGIGIPMVSSNTFSSVNIGLDLGQKTNGTPGALNEKYFGFNIGIIIAPSKADYWFRKVKLD